MQNPTRAEAERLLGIAEKLLQSRDLMGSREFAVLAQETEPLLEGSDQILAIVDVLIAAEKRVNSHPDWYAVLQVERRSDDIDFIKKQYRRLALLLHPDKSRFAFSDHAFKLVADAWALLSDPVRKSVYDKDLSFFSRVDLTVPSWVQQDKLPVRRTGPGPGPSTRNSASARDEIHAEENARRRNNNNTTNTNNNNSNNNNSNNLTFWTACPYCYRLYEYSKVYEGCCLRCQNCDRSFHGVVLPELPPLVPGQDAYYCCWGFFPMGFVSGGFGSPETEVDPVEPTQTTQPTSSLPNWMPAPAANGGGNETVTRVTRSSAATAVAAVAATANGVGPRKRGRPRKYPLAS